MPAVEQGDEFDVIIVGAGLVGLALAGALRGAGLRLALVDRVARPAALSAEPEGWDQRMYAISPGSEAFLAAQGAWPGSARVARVAGMQVSGDAGGHIAFDA